MAEARNIRRTIDTFFVMNWHITNLETNSGCAKEEIKVTERVEVTEEGTLRGDLAICRSSEGFSPAESVSDWLAKKERESRPKESVS
jgi:hypothetical protein